MGIDYKPPYLHHPPYIKSKPIFDDLKEDNWKRKWAETLYLEKLTSSYDTDPLCFCPDREVTRAEMATFLLKIVQKL